QLLEGVEDLEGRFLRGAAVLDVADAEIATPAGRLALRVDHPPGRLALDVEDVLAGPAAVDLVDRLAALGGVCVHAGEGRREANLPAVPETNPDHDFLVALAPSLLDVDVALEGAGDRRREVAARKLLRTLVGREVSIRDVDRLVRHQSIVTPQAAARNYT